VNQKKVRYEDALKFTDSQSLFSELVKKKP